MNRFARIASKVKVIEITECRNYNYYKIKGNINHNKKNRNKYIILIKEIRY